MALTTQTEIEMAIARLKGARNRIDTTIKRLRQLQGDLGLAQRVDADLRSAKDKRRKT